MVFYVYSDLIVQGIRHVTLLAQKRCGKPSTLHIAWYAAPLRVLNALSWYSHVTRTELIVQELSVHPLVQDSRELTKGEHWLTA